MLFCYSKPKNGMYYIYESGTTYIGRTQVKVNRIYMGLDGKPLIFPYQWLAFHFCIDRNDIISM